MQAALGLFSAGSVSGTGAARRPRAFLCSPAGGAERSCPRAARSTHRGRLSWQPDVRDLSRQWVRQKRAQNALPVPGRPSEKSSKYGVALRRSPLGGGRCRAHQKHQSHSGSPSRGPSPSQIHLRRVCRSFRYWHVRFRLCDCGLCACMHRRHPLPLLCPPPSWHCLRYRPSRRPVPPCRQRPFGLPFLARAVCPFCMPSSLP